MGSRCPLHTTSKAKMKMITCIPRGLSRLTWFQHGSPPQHSCRLTWHQSLHTKDRKFGELGANQARHHVARVQAHPHAHWLFGVRHFDLQGGKDTGVAGKVWELELHATNVLERSNQRHLWTMYEGKLATQAPGTLPDKKPDKSIPLLLPPVEPWQNS